MIQQLEGHITENQINEIVRIIIDQYKKYCRLINCAQFLDIFSEEYAPHKENHSISWAISSAFPSESIVAENLQVKRLKYGRGHTRPALVNEHIELHILNYTVNRDSKYLKERYAYNKNNFLNNKLYCFIMFKVENKQLVNLTLCLPDENGIPIEETLLDKSAILRKVA